MATRGRKTARDIAPADRKFPVGDAVLKVRRSARRVKAAKAKDETQPLSIWEKLRQWGGKCEGLPPDLARNHDHYLHGTPRR